MYHILICYKDWNNVSKAVLFGIFIHIEKEPIILCMQKESNYLDFCVNILEVCCDIFCTFILYE